MAVQPLFITDMNALKAQLRLSGASQSDALAMIDSAVQQARARFYSSLGAVQVTALLAIPYVDNPTTDDGAKRLKANGIELDITKLSLLRSMPILFMDSSGIKREVWNEEGFARRLDEKYISDEIARLENDIASGLGDLAADSGDSGGAVSGGAIGPLCRPLPPGYSVFGLRGHGRT